MKVLTIPESGSYQGLTASRNRFGQYMRSRAIPVNPNTSYQSTVRARLAHNASGWRGLTSSQMAGWAALGLLMVRTDSLGQSYDLTGFQAFCSVNNNLMAAGDAEVTDAPALATPDAIATGTVTTTGGTLSVAYTPTPLGTGERLFCFASPQRSAGRVFEGDYRLIGVSAAAAASPYNALTAYTARCGAPVVGNKIFFNLVRYLSGFLSLPLQVTKVVTA